MTFQDFEKIVSKVKLIGILTKKLSTEVLETFNLIRIFFEKIKEVPETERFSGGIRSLVGTQFPKHF